jgi:hypothetical protein
VIVNSLLLTVAMAVVGLRLYRRLIVCRSTRLDDLFIALALVSIHVLNVSKHPPNQLPVSSYQIDHCSMSKY